MVKSRAAQRTGQREAAREMAQRIESDWKKTFPEAYWQDWLRWMADNS
jgi:hypothetical protein